MEAIAIFKKIIKPAQAYVLMACSAGVASFFILSLVNESIGRVIPPTSLYIATLLIISNTNIFFTINQILITRRYGPLPPNIFDFSELLRFELFFAKSLQKSLRFSINLSLLISISLVVIICTRYDQPELVPLLGGIFSVVITLGFVVKHYGINPKTWWFLWSGPIVAVINPNLLWLAETYSHYDYRIISAQTVKFRKSSVAVAFKLVSG